MDTQPYPRAWARFTVLSLLAGLTGAAFLGIAADLCRTARQEERARASLQQHYGPALWQTMDRFASAVNGNDFNAVYALLVPHEYDGVPHLSKEDLRTLLYQRMTPPFPRDLRLGTAPLFVNPDRDAYQDSADGRGGFTVTALQLGKGVRPTGEWSNFFTVATQRSGSGWGVRPFFTFSDYYRRTYGDLAAYHFRQLYLELADHRGLPMSDRLRRLYLN